MSEFIIPSFPDVSMHTVVQFICLHHYQILFHYLLFVSFTIMMHLLYMERIFVFIIVLSILFYTPLLLYQERRGCTRIAIQTTIIPTGSPKVGSLVQMIGELMKSHLRKHWLTITSKRAMIIRKVFLLHYLLRTHG